MQLKQALASAVERLDAADVGSPRMNAEVLLMFVLGADRAYLYAHPERELTPEEAARYEEVLAQRATGMPSQYITGHQEFWGLDFVVSPAVLIPRPETEHLVEAVLELARGVQRPKLVDVGTGSGCIALALAHELPDAEVYAVDLSADALEIARANAARLQLDERVRFLQCNVLEPMFATSFPVIPSEDFSPSRGASLFRASRLRFRGQQSAVRRFQRSRQGAEVGAGFRAKDGRLRRRARDRRDRPAGRAGARTLKPGGWLALEIGYSMRDAVVNLLSPTMWEDVRVVPDLQGIPRVVAAKKKSN